MGARRMLGLVLAVTTGVSLTTSCQESDLNQAQVPGTDAELAALVDGCDEASSNLGEKLFGIERKFADDEVVELVTEDQIVAWLNRLLADAASIRSELDVIKAILDDLVEAGNNIEPRIGDPERVVLGVGVIVCQAEYENGLRSLDYHVRAIELLQTVYLGADKEKLDVFPELVRRVRLPVPDNETSEQPPNR